jgi:hypothetical protein
MTPRAVLAPILVVLLTVAACGEGGEATDTPTAAPSTAATGSPGASGTASTPTQEPTPEASPTEAQPTDAGPTDEPTEEPTDEPGAEPTGAAAACTGNEQNQAFFASVAAAVDWPVLCLAEDGWFVTTGSYSLRDGGRLEIGYRGPGGATLDVREGYICDGDGCAPQGLVLGDVALGELGNAQLIQLEADEYAVVADPDANPSWILVSGGLSGDELTDLAAGFATVADD